MFSKLPVNLVPKDAHFFNKYKRIQSQESNIKQLKNVFVNQQGLVLKNGLLVEGCAFNLNGKLDNRFYYLFWRKTIEQYLVSKFGNSLKSITLNDDRNYLLIHSAWFNYSFWVNSFLIRLITAIKNNGITNLCLIYPEEWDSISYVKESLSYFEISIQIIPKDHHIFVKKLLMPTTRKWTNSFDKFTIRYVYDWFSFLIPIQKPTRRIYLTRKKRNVRCVQNELELIEILKVYDFEVISFEDLAFIEQVKTMMNCSHFVSIHGAGFSNMVFMQPNTSVLELINFEYAKKEYTFPFWKLADSLELDYYYQFGYVKNNYKCLNNNNKYEINEDSLVNQNIYVKTDVFEENIKCLIANIKMLSCD
jgi:hypothetical protein